MNSQTFLALAEPDAVAVAMKNVIRESDLDVRGFRAEFRRGGQRAAGRLAPVDQLPMFRAGVVFDDHEMRSAGQLSRQAQSRNDSQHQTQAEQTRHHPGSAVPSRGCV
jgi:hypothetical protein